MWDGIACVNWWITFEQSFNIRHMETTSFHPQSNGSLEWTHAVVKDLTRTCTTDRQNNWDEYLKLICMEYNTSMHETTGHIPFEGIFGLQANLPSPISITISLIKEQLFNFWLNQHKAYIVKARQIAESNKRRYQGDQTRKVINTQTVSQVKDKVWIHNEYIAH